MTPGAERSLAQPTHTNSFPSTPMYVSIRSSLPSSVLKRTFIHGRNHSSLFFLTSSVFSPYCASLFLAAVCRYCCWPRQIIPQLFVVRLFSQFGQLLEQKQQISKWIQSYLHNLGYRRSASPGHCVRYDGIEAVDILPSLISARSFWNAIWPEPIFDAEPDSCHLISSWQEWQERQQAASFGTVIFLQIFCPFR